MENFQIYEKPREIYREMLNDIRAAKKSIFLETYIYTNDEVGRKFRDALIKKVSEGVEVKVLIDAFGSDVTKDFFEKLVAKGGEFKFFKEFKYVIRIVSKNHERNHRKMLIIDNDVTYIGSINITAQSLDWRELVLRFEGDLTNHFVSSFMYSWDSANLLSARKIKLRIYRGFEILEDMPRSPKKMTRSKYTKLLKSAKKEILIETPYFIPPTRIRRALAHAVKKGVKVKILLPDNSDVQLIDVFRNRYLGSLHRAGVEIFFYTPKILHSKLLVVDTKFFLLGSSNVDYRSFLHQHEVNLFGNDKELIHLLKEFFYSGLEKSKPFKYHEWKNRSSIDKIIELIVDWVKEYL